RPTTRPATAGCARTRAATAARSPPAACRARADRRSERGPARRRARSSSDRRVWTRRGRARPRRRRRNGSPCRPAPERAGRKRRHVRDRRFRREASTILEVAKLGWEVRVVAEAGQERAVLGDLEAGHGAEPPPDPLAKEPHVEPEERADEDPARRL